MFGDKMIEDGYFIQFFRDDETKIEEPRNIIVIKNGKVSFYVNPKESEVDKKWLFALKEKLSKLEDNKKLYEFEASLLENFWDWNGYTPNPSDFIEPDKYDGKYDSLMKKWG